MHYYLVAVVILALHVPEDRVGQLREAMPRQVETATTIDGILEALALNISGIAFTTKIPAVIVNAFGPMAYCELPTQKTASSKR
jgi:hypothetical protein